MALRVLSFFQVLKDSLTLAFQDSSPMLQIPTERKKTEFFIMGVTKTPSKQTKNIFDLNQKEPKLNLFRVFFGFVSRNQK
jgi:hypothetical protein